MTDITVVTEESVAVEAPDETPKPAIKSLRDRRAALKDKLHLDLQVPRWEDPEIWVRYGPIDVTRADKVLESRRNSKLDEWAVLANADILASACTEIWAHVADDETRYSLNVNGVIGEGPLTRFDPSLAQVLDLPPTSKATDVVRELYWTDGDLVQAANALVDWSGQESNRADTDFSSP